MLFDFDTPIDRSNTGARKTDDLSVMFGRTDIRPLWIADMDFAVHPAITEALRKRIDHPVYGYSTIPDAFWQSIISWLSRRHGWDVERRDLTFTPGIVRGIGYIINYFTSRGDKIVIQPPVYPPFRRLTEGNGRIVVENPLIINSEGNYEMDIDSLERIFSTERPKLMILCNPHNPIGIQWSRETLARVARAAAKWGVTVVSDEIHGDLMLRGRRHIPFMASCPEAEQVGITLGAPSKTFNIPGLASSWIVIKNPALRDGFFDWMETNEFGEPVMMAVTATMAAYNQAEPWLDAVIPYIEANIDLVSDFTSCHLPGVKAIMPEASFLVWLDFRNLHLSHDSLIDLMVNEAHLALNDGATFGPQGSGFMRLNVASPRSALTAALCGLRSAILK